MRDSFRRLVRHRQKAGDSQGDDSLRSSSVPDPPQQSAKAHDATPVDGQVAQGSRTGSPDRFRGGLTSSLASNGNTAATTGIHVPASSTTAAATGTASAGNNGSVATAVPGTIDTDNMWIKADRKLREDRKGRAKMEKYDIVLATYFSGSSTSTITTNPQQVIARLKAGVKSLQEDTNVGFRQYTESAKRCVVSLVRCVVKLESLINTAAQSCLPASLACSGVIMLSRLCLDAADEREILFEGLEPVAGAIRRMAEYEELMWQPGIARLEEVEKSLVAACTNILDFQARAALFLEGNPVQSAIRSAFKSDGWGQLLSSIKEAESAVLQSAQRKGLRQIENIFGIVQEFPRMIDEGFARHELRRADIHRQEAAEGFLKCLLHKACVSIDIKDRNRKRADQTCKWFTGNKSFHRWHSSTTADAPELLFVTADPGCGKSVLSRYLIDDILDKDGSLVCYFFFKDDVSEQRHAKSALCTLLHQIFTARPALLTDEILATYRSYEEKLFDSLNLLWDIFISTAARQNTVVLLDALDECRDDDRQALISKVIETFQRGNPKAGTGTALKFLMTSRPYGVILRTFRQLPESQLQSIHLQADQGDLSNEIAEEIRAVVDVRIAETARRFQLSNTEHRLMTEKLHAIQHRTYLWVTLLFDGLLKQGGDLNKKKILELTKNPPKNIYEQYEAILTKSTDIKIARKILRIVLAAKEPFTVTQLAVALAIDGFDQTKDDMLDSVIPAQRARETIKDCCGLFIVLVDDWVYLLHQTAREFLVDGDVQPHSETSTPLQPSLPSQWKFSISMTAANATLAEICIIYLIANYRDRVSFLYDYAVCYWADHYRSSDLDFQQTAVKEAWSLCSHPSSRDYEWRGPADEIGFCPEMLEGPALCMAAALGIDTIIAHALDTLRGKHVGPQIDVNCRCVRDRTPLHWAVSFEHYTTVEKLLAVPELNVNALDCYKNTPLHIAIGKQDTQMVQLLLASGKVDMDCKDGNDKNLLVSAMCMGDKDFVEVLLGTGHFDVNSRDSHGVPTLHHAVYSSNRAVMEIMLKQHHMDVDARDTYGQTAFMRAAEWGSAANVDLLLKTGKVNVNARDHKGCTALSLAATNDHEQIVRLLLAINDVAIDARDNDGNTPLALAASLGREQVVRLLLETDDVNVDARNNDGNTPLALAAIFGYTGVMDILVTEGKADVDIQNDDGFTPLTVAGSQRAEEMRRQIAMWSLLP